MKVIVAFSITARMLNGPCSLCPTYMAPEQVQAFFAENQVLHCHSREEAALVQRVLAKCDIEIDMIVIDESLFFVVQDSLVLIGKALGNENDDVPPLNRYRFLHTQIARF